MAAQNCLRNSVAALWQERIWFRMVSGSGWWIASSALEATCMSRTTLDATAWASRWKAYISCVAGLGEGLVGLAGFARQTWEKSMFHVLTLAASTDDMARSWSSDLSFRIPGGPFSESSFESTCRGMTAGAWGARRSSNSICSSSWGQLNLVSSLTSSTTMGVEPFRPA